LIFTIVELNDNEKNKETLKIKFDLDLDKYLKLIQTKNQPSEGSRDILELFDHNKQEFDKAIVSAKSKDDFHSSIEFLINNYGEKYNWDLNDERLNFLLKDIYRHYKKLSS